MKNQISVNANLEIVKEKVANLSDADMNLMVGGNSEAAASTRTNFTCSWCTSTTSIEENA